MEFSFVSWEEGRAGEEGVLRRLVASPGKRVKLRKRWSVHYTHVRNMRHSQIREAKVPQVASSK